MTTDTTFHIDTGTTDSPLGTYLPKRRRDVEADVPSQAEEPSPIAIEPEPALATAPVAAPGATAPDDDREKLFADYLSTRSKQIKALARAYEYELRARYEHREALRAIFAGKHAEESEHAAMYEAYADALQAELEGWPA